MLLGGARLIINTVWMAWTEDPDDPLAQSLRARFERSGFALAGLAGRIREAGARFGADAARVKTGGLDAFSGLASPESTKAQPRLQTRDILLKLKQTAKQVRYLEPGETRRTPGAVSLPVHVLGPPRDLTLLLRDKPSTVTPETYLDAPSVDGQQLMRIAEGDWPDPAKDSPFAPDYCRFTIADMDARLAAADDADARSCEYLRQHYTAPPAWRRGRKRRWIAGGSTATGWAPPGRSR